jgi:hypothetical protein
MPERPRDVPRFSENCKQWDQSQQHCIPDTNSYLQVRLVPIRIRRVQRQRLVLEMVSTKKPPIPCVKQLARTPAVIISPWVDILAGRLKNQDCVLSMTDSTTAKGWLRKSNLPIGQKPHPSVCQDQSMSKAGNPLHIPRHQMLQPMVCKREKPSVGRSPL